jgi:YD repeat-containing protein
MTTTFHRTTGWISRVLLSAVLLLWTGAALSASAVHTYDALGRLTKVTYSNGVVITYVYDAAGNRTSVVVTGAPG